MVRCSERSRIAATATRWSPNVISRIRTSTGIVAFFPFRVGQTPGPHVFDLFDGHGQIGRLKTDQNTQVYSYRPFSFWTNVRVEHSCYSAFGFVCGIRVLRLHRASGAPTEDYVQTLAFSGDTRPCWKFVQQCLRDCSARNGGVLGYLIHEATFDDTHQAKSIEKKLQCLATNAKQSSRVTSTSTWHFSYR